MRIDGALIRAGEVGINASAIAQLLFVRAGSATNSLDTGGFSSFDGWTRLARGTTAIRVGILQALSATRAIVEPRFASNGTRARQTGCFAVRI